MKPKIYIGLDVAETTGIAIYDGDWAKVTTVKGYPYNQNNHISRLASRFLREDYNVTVVMEQPVHFRGAKQTRSLLQRYGYIRWSLLYAGINVLEANLNSVRAFLKCKSKNEVLDLMLPNFTGMTLTDDMTDALACCLYQAHQEGDLELPIIPAITNWSD